MKTEKGQGETLEQPASPIVPKVGLKLRVYTHLRRHFVLILCCLAGAVAFYMLGRVMVYREHPEFAAQEQAAAILAKVGQLILLPEGESPTMVAIADAESVKKGQPFLEKAMNGDILIVYRNAATALLYRESTNKLVAVGPVSSESGTADIQNAQQSAITPVTTKNATATTSTNR